jgi:hypothetical protein
MDVIGAGLIDGANFLAQLGEVGGQNGGGKADRLGHGQPYINHGRCRTVFARRSR